MERLHQNPVWSGSFADPFVWKHEDTYYAVGTGPVGVGESQREWAFPILFSRDFFNWQSVGGALRVPDFLHGGEFWAPEVAWDGQNFYLYYSVSTEGLHHRLRVAKSVQPQGPYEDVGLLMSEGNACPFAIDPHPFQDEDGQWLLFYARDFLEAEAGVRAGTALVVDRLIGMTKLAEEERVVLRARSDWQRFRSNRLMYGQIFDWHTLEGPFVRKHGGRYYCFFSGGCYENETYGVDYGVADSVLGPYSDAGNESGPRVMRSVPGRLIGPGHNSIVLGPDGRTEYVAYHAWDCEWRGRQFCLAKLAWTAEGPRLEQPVEIQDAPQPAQASESNPA